MARPKIFFLFKVFFCCGLAVLAFGKLEARLVSLDVLVERWNDSKKIYLFGDCHEVGYQSVEEDQLRQLFGLLLRRKEKVSILIEDIFALEETVLKGLPSSDTQGWFLQGLAERIESLGNKLTSIFWKKKVNSLIEDLIDLGKEISTWKTCFLPGLVQRIRCLDNDFVKVFGIEERSILNSAFHYFSPYYIPGFWGGDSFDGILKGERPNNYKYNFDGLFREIGNITNTIKKGMGCLFENSMCFKVLKEKLFFAKKEFDLSKKLLFEKHGFRMTDSILDCAIYIFLKDIENSCVKVHGNRRFIWPFFRNRVREEFDEIERRLCYFIMRYPYGMDEATWEKESREIRGKIYHFRARYYSSGPTCKRRPFSAEINRSLSDLGAHLLDCIIFLNILFLLKEDGPIVVFAGAWHTENLKEMLKRIGFAYCDGLSVPYSRTSPFPVHKISF